MYYRKLRKVSDASSNVFDVGYTQKLSDVQIKKIFNKSFVTDFHGEHVYVKEPSVIFLYGNGWNDVDIFPLNGLADLFNDRFLLSIEEGSVEAATSDADALEKIKGLVDDWGIIEEKGWYVPTEPFLEFAANTKVESIRDIIENTHMWEYQLEVPRLQIERWIEDNPEYEEEIKDYFWNEDWD